MDHFSNKVRHSRGTQERREKADQTNTHGLFPFRPEYPRIELRAGQKREHDSAGAGQEADPSGLRAQHFGADEGADDELRNRADHDFRKRRRDPEPN